jgi:hypothetical protein
MKERVFFRIHYREVLRTYNGLHDAMDICKLEDLSGLEIWAPAPPFIHLETICARGASSAYDVTRRHHHTHTLHATAGWRLTKVHCRWVRGKDRGLEGIRKIVRGLDMQNRIIVGRKDA